MRRFTFVLSVLILASLNCQAAFPFSFWKASSSAPKVVTLVQHTNVDGASSTTQALAFSSGNTAGNLIVLAFRVGSATPVISVVDTNLNTYTQVFSQTDASPNSNTTYLYYAKNVAGGANTVTVTITGASSNRMAIYEVSGCSTTSPLDVNTVTHNTVTSSSFSSGSVTTTDAVEFVIGPMGCNAVHTVTGGSGWTAGDIVPAAPNTKFYVQYRITSSTATLTSDGSLSSTVDYYSAGIAGFK